jgi:hypothetical protein
MDLEFVVGVLGKWYIYQFSRFINNFAAHEQQDIMK